MPRKNVDGGSSIGIGELKQGAAVGMIAGLASGAAFSLLVSMALLAILSISVNFGSVFLEAIMLGASFGLCAGIICSFACKRLPSGSSWTNTTSIAAAFAIPWGYLWLTILPLSFIADANSYTMFIHKLGIETPWLRIPVSSQQVIDLEDFFSVGAYLVAYLLILIVWVVVLGVLLGYVKNKKI